MRLPATSGDGRSPGQDAEHLQVQLGQRLDHSTISVTLDTYSHVLPSMQEDAVRRIEDAMSVLDGRDGPRSELTLN